jgi:hypothetical protein
MLISGRFAPITKRHDHPEGSGNQAGDTTGKPASPQEKPPA